MVQDSLGTILKHYRVEAGLSIAQVEDVLKINRKNILALEEGNYSSLPENLYTKNFVKSYARYLGLSVPKVIALYTQERAHVSKAEPPITSSKKGGLPTITPSHIKRGIVIIIVVTLLFYLGLQVRQIFAPPELIITNPMEGLITSQTFIEISGQTEREAIVHINDKEIFIDKEGHFSATLDLQGGLNIIKISAKKKNSRENILFREILVKE